MTCTVLLTVLSYLALSIHASSEFGVRVVSPMDKVFPTGDLPRSLDVPLVAAAGEAIHVQVRKQDVVLRIIFSPLVNYFSALVNLLLLTSTRNVDDLCAIEIPCDDIGL